MSRGIWALSCGSKICQNPLKRWWGEERERKEKSKEQKYRAIFSLDIQGHGIQKEGTSESHGYKI